MSRRSRHSRRSERDEHRPRESPVPRRRTWLALAGGLLVVVAASAALLAARGRDRNGSPAQLRRVTAGNGRGAPIVLVSIDTLRSDHLPAYGYRGVETPALDALRRDAVLFARAYSQVPLTLPAHVSILTGRLPVEHGVRDNSGFPFSAAEHPYLSRLLAEAGYATGAFVSSFVLHGSTGLAAGFDAYDAGHPGEELRAELLERPASETVGAAVRWLETVRDRPFFLFVHFYEPHAAYRPPEPFASRYRAAPYDGEIAAADAALGSLMRALRETGVYDRALVVLLSDHGEGLGDHGEAGHGVLLYREALQVPLMLKLPGGARRGATLPAPVALVDVAPTLLRLAGLTVPPAMSGRDLLEAGGERAAARERRIYSETLYPRLHLGWSELTSLIAGPLHYIHGPAPELFDLDADPAERTDVLSHNRRAYAALRDEVVALAGEAPAPGPVDAETARRLAALGYSGTPRRAEGPLPDPRREREALEELEAAKQASSAQRWAEAATILERLVRRRPALLDGWLFLASCLEHLDRPEETLAAYQRALELGAGAPEYAFYVARQLYVMGRLDEAKRHAALMLAGDAGSRRDAHELLAAVALRQGDLDGALAASRRAGRASAPFRADLARALALRGRFDEAVALAREGSPPDPSALEALALGLSERGRAVEAAAILDRLAGAFPDRARVHELLGIVTLRRGDPAAARRHLERALAIDRRLPDAWTSLGVALLETAGPDAALAAWQEALALDPRQPEALLDVGLVAARTGRHEEARDALRRYLAAASPETSAADLRKARRILEEVGG